MSTNCLVTKLKTVVNNDNLSKLGVLTIRTKTLSGTPNISQQCCLVISATENVTLKVIGGYCSTDPNNIEIDKLTEVTFINMKVLYFKNADYRIEISNKYAISQLRVDIEASYKEQLFKFNIDEMYKLNVLSTLEIWRTHSIGNIGSLKYCNIRTLNLGGCAVEGYIEEIGNSDLRDVTFNTNVGNVYGNVESLSNRVSLNALDLEGTVIEGTIETMLNQMATQRNSGTLIITTNANVFYQGIQYPARTINVTFSDSGWSVS